jgi:chemotaxis protein CheX
MSEFTAEGLPPVASEIRDKLVEPFITATRAALGEMARTEVVAGGVYQNRGHHLLADVTAVIRLTSAIDGCLVLSFPERTAATLARRILADVSVEVDEQLTHDCVGEIGNVVAGQAKALLAGTPYAFGFSFPTVIVDVKDFHPPAGLDCLIVDLRSNSGEFTLQLFLRL